MAAFFQGVPAVARLSDVKHVLTFVVMTSLTFTAVHPASSDMPILGQLIRRSAQIWRLRPWMTVRSLANRRKAAAGIQILAVDPTTVSPASRYFSAPPDFQSVQEIGLSETTKCERSRAGREPPDGRE